MKLALVGPTACGKTEAAVLLAEHLGAEIVSADSMLVYRGMDVGTAKPDEIVRGRVPHHLIDVVEPSQPFSVARFQRLGRDVMGEIEARGKTVLLAGGSGLYVRALVDPLEFPGTDAETRHLLELEAATVGAGQMYERLRELDPVAAGKIETGNIRRTVRALEVAGITGRLFSSYADAWETYPTEDVRLAGIEMDRDVLEGRIRRRVQLMVEEGVLDEVSELVARGFGDWFTSTQAIGYAEFAAHLRGGLSLEEAMEGTVKRTKELARRQRAWFRRDPRIAWFPVGEAGAVEAVGGIERFFEGADLASVGAHALVTSEHESA